MREIFYDELGTLKLGLRVSATGEVTAKVVLPGGETLNTSVPANVLDMIRNEDPALGEVIESITDAGLDGTPAPVSRI
jgi:hypothetical protein